ncbi:MAG: insulinase family protein [Flavobacteriales bacterium]|nr:insulinase family protein [Flavobacteriales bacterium]
MTTRSTSSSPVRALAFAHGLFASCIMYAQADRGLPPEPGPPPVVRVGDHVTFALPNGLRVIVVEDHKLPLVGVQFHADIPPMVIAGKAGLTDLVGETIATGTRTRDKAAIDEAVDAIGATFETSADGVYAACLKEHVPQLMGLFRDVVTAPSFPDAEVDAARKNLASLLRQRTADPEGIADAVIRRQIYGKAHPYGDIAAEHSVLRITAADARAWHARYFRPDKGYLVLVGAITEKEARKLAKDHFGKWKATVPVPKNLESGEEKVPGLGDVRYLRRTATPGEKRRVFVHDRPGATQSVVRVGHPLNLKPNDLRALDARVMNTIFGGGTFSSRLMDNLREDKGWAYGAYSEMDPDRYNTAMIVSVSVRTDATSAAVGEIIAEMERMRGSTPGTEELELARSTMAGAFSRALEEPRTVARFALEQQLNDLPKDHYRTWLERLSAVGKQQVRSAAEAFLRPEGVVILVVGDLEAIRDELEKFSDDLQEPIVVINAQGEPMKEVLVAVPGITPQGLIDGHLEAIGGRAKAERIDDLRITWSGTMDGDTVLVEQWIGSRGRYRSRLVSKGVTVEEVVLDGQRAVRRSPAGDEELFDIDLRDIQLIAAPVPEVDMDRIAERMTVSGRTPLGRGQAYKLHIKTRPGPTWQDYFDVETGMRLRRVEMKFMHGRGLTITTDYLDHKPVLGVLFPHRIEQRGGIRGRTILEVTNIEANKGFPQGFFETGLPPPED